MPAAVATPAAISASGNDAQAGPVSINALAAAATSPALPPSAQAIPAPKAHTATAAMKARSCGAVNHPSRAAPPVASDAPSVSRNRPWGVSFSAIAPTIAALPPATIADPGGPNCRTTATTASRPSSTAPTSLT